MPSGVTAMAPISRNPACATDEYAIIRLTSVWVRPSTAPITMDSVATAHSTPRHSHRVEPKATVNTRRMAPNAATLVQAAMNAVTGVGAPWYTSGVQAWNGPTD